MKLSTRLALVVSLILVSVTMATSTQAYLSMKSEKLSSIDNALSNITTQLDKSSEDDLSLSFYLASQSPIPMSLVYVTDSKEVTFLLENAGSNFDIPTKENFLKGVRKNLESSKNIEHYYPINSKEYLAFFISTESIKNELSHSLRSILIFNLVIILLSIFLIVFIFRRDSKLNSAAKEMQEFIGDASHELKTPLTVVRGYSELLIDNPELSQKYAKRINEESLRMTRIIDQLLKIAALDEGQASAPALINVNEFLESQIEDLRALQPSRRITWIANELVINAPFDLFETLITNIFANIRSHTPADAPIKISIEGKVLTIEDGGPGLKEIPDKPFKRFDSSRSRETGGSGLGMSLIQKSAKAIGAKLIFSQSNLGGLKITIHF
jgi:signal transduction histidine kinase